MDILKTKEDLLNKLRAYSETPDDDSIRYKNIIKKKLLNCPELLYALNVSELESELFDGNGDLLIDENTGELLGEVDRYFGDNAYIRPTLYFPDTQTDVSNYICYQVLFDETPKNNKVLKYTKIIFTIFVNGSNRTDVLTGIPRHDLIGSIIREKFNWTNIFGCQTYQISSKESITDNDFLVKTLIFQTVDTNGLAVTQDGKTNTINHQLRK